MKKDEILISEKYGVNPSMTTCFYCGEVTGIALLGKLKNDAEAPRYICDSIEPCDKCKKKFKDSILIVEKEDEKSDPTGRWAAVKINAVSPELRNNKIMFMVVDDFEQLFGGE